VVIALGHEEYHHRGRQPSDAVQEYLRRRLCLRRRHPRHEHHQHCEEHVQPEASVPVLSLFSYL